ncbi:MAG: hypothetical protein A3F83_10455 [Candidatus Glassbacteria bacterium RIFCSPLOWO2_12_FULL_58_11]|uniref:Uncharacterized protein n=2 Tax=Candidatus Glassiibacteriota TaxID=1817805 RepID=A0A1F5YZ29_9BACT|nr:MAG: hypothetical protein A2Z86_05695 [Candidatus Glassbacteria bacterium GWA2_58_10]OGG05448.1 MAG: hypothetical protein A3F83_10455 [Candidatus Glassbacteria bacterium RIFCSPLOWO2_12_FULL_58_11]
MTGLLRRPRLLLNVSMILSLTLGTGMTLLRAQEQGRQPSREEMQKRTEERFEKMCEVLALDENQKHEAHKLLDKERVEVQKIFEATRGGSLSREEARTQMRKINEDYLAKVEALLKGDQKEKMKEWRANRPERGGRGGDGGGGRGGRPGGQGAA